MKTNRLDLGTSIIELKVLPLVLNSDGVEPKQSFEIGLQRQSIIRLKVLSRRIRSGL